MWAPLRPPRHWFTAERALSAELEISRATLRRALGRLEQEGLVERHAQRGWFVVRRDDVVTGPPGGSLSDARRVGAGERDEPRPGVSSSGSASRILRKEVRPATLREADALQIAPAAPVVHINRLRFRNAAPLSYDDIVMPAERAHGLVEADLGDRSLYERLATLCDIVVDRSSYTLVASLADPLSATILGVEVGAPVLVGDEIAMTHDGTPVLLATNTFRGDTYRFQVELHH